MFRERALGGQAFAGKQFLCENIAPNGIVEKAVLTLFAAGIQKVGEHEETSDFQTGIIVTQIDIIKNMKTESFLNPDLRYNRAYRNKGG